MPRKTQPGSALDWLTRAQGDLAIASAALPPGAFLEDLCFHAQQAAEKSLKAVFVHHGIAFRYTHDLDELTTGLKQSGIEVPATIDDATVLTAFAWEARYPGTGEPVTQNEYTEAVIMARTVVDWTLSVLQID
jgi:HEPN domain-containing protein